jgi:hypothetical protein
MPLEVSHVPSTLSREEFDYACLSFYEQRRRRDKEDKLLAIQSGWKWHPHSLKGYGYLTRKRTLTRSSDAPDSDNDEPEDEATLTPSGPIAALVMKEFVVYSATYRVPAYCFTIHDAREHR